MIDNLPSWINWLFLLIVIITIGTFHYANAKPKKVTLFIISWAFVQSILAYNGFYENTAIVPPRFLLVLIPVTVFILFGLTKTQKNWVITNRNMEISTFLHTIRIPVEIILFYLFSYKMVPELMTFNGRNFDILAGISAPIIGLLFINNKIGPKTVMVWNSLVLCLVLFVFINGILSSNSPIQMFGFEQPNRALNYFPFVLLPATIVPIVIYTHLTDFIKLAHMIKNK